MARGWRDELKSGVALREAIRNADIEQVCEQLKNCWREIHRKFPDEYDEWDLEDDIDSIDEALENYNDFNEVEEIDYVLDQLYEYCDNTRIFISLK